jgi:hypothetical protein
MSTERAMVFSGGSASLWGILHLPGGAGGEAGRGNRVGIVFLHGWSGCRLGPHRMFVHAAREFSALGYPCLRFDFGGRGESDGPVPDASIRSMVDDTGKAMAFLLSGGHADRVLLLGICSGGKVAIGRAVDDPRAAGLILWSCEPMGHLGDAGRGARRSASALGLYLRKLLKPATWAKILTLRVNTRMVQKAMFAHEHASEEELADEDGMLARFETYRGPALFVYGSADPETRAAAQSYRAFCGRLGIPAEFHEVMGANHSYYSLEWEREVMGRTRDWLVNRFPPG